MKTEEEILQEIEENFRIKIDRTNVKLKGQLINAYKTTFIKEKQK